ncbi:hypothetical protein [uncultured Tateyamaria sp.]|uniref:hypothetical protein n=1 Tax=Tateyamaria sp. 1078 TaxID=3417464 RepID=UPI0026176166|nr:hypothetical protein [uncultured Tateyamaria sp.]
MKTIGQMLEANNRDVRRRRFWAWFDQQLFRLSIIAAVYGAVWFLLITARAALLQQQ